MIGDLDGITLDDEGNPAVLEIKTASEFKRSEWEAGVPVYYQVQIQHYLAITGFSKAYAAVLVGGNSFKIIGVDADIRMQEAMIRVEEAFWDLVVSNEKPPVDGSDASARLLNDLFKGGNKDVMELSAESEKLITEYLKASEMENKAKKRKQKAANGLKEAMKDHDRAVYGSHTVSWSPVEAEKFDTASFKAAEPELYAKYLKRGSYRRFTVR